MRAAWAPQRRVGDATVHVHGFPKLSSVRNEFVDSPEFMLLGNQWGVWSYFHVDAMMQPKEMVSLYLCNMSNKVIKMKFGFSVNHGNNGKQVACTNNRPLQNILVLWALTPEPGDFQILRNV